jgi:hypothetical protein
MSESYDGTTSLGKAIAHWLNFSPKNQTEIAKRLKAAKEALGIPHVVGVRLTAEQKVAVWSWYKKNFHPDGSYISADGALHNPDGSTEQVINGIYSCTHKDGSGELSTEWGDVEYVATAELPDHLIELDTDEPLELDLFKRIAFYTMENGVRVRKVIALEFDYLNVLAFLAEAENKTVPEWLEEITYEWEEKNMTKSLTRFVRHEIFRHHRMY